MNKIHEHVQNRKPRSSAFDLSHEKKLSLKMGQLTPCLIQEVVPGDNFKGRTETMIRMAPMVAPVMHRVNTYIHYFFVPNRIIWNQWEDFITGGREGTTSPVMPKVSLNATYAANGTLADYLGVPFTTLGATVNALPFWAYQQIYNDYYRDPNLSTPVDLTTSLSNAAELRMRAWEKDYFTSSLPWPQRGPDVNLPIEVDNKKPSLIRDSTNDAVQSNITGLGTTALGSLIRSNQSGNTLYVDGAEETLDVTINELRTSSALQRWLEKQARGGYRYIETILSQFGVKSSDKRLQRAEYIGGGQSPMVISEVLNTSATATDPQGNMAGHGVGTGASNTFKYKAEEHGYIIGIMSVLPRTAYQQGIPRHFNRADKTDFYWPEFANLGEQEVKNKEIYFNPQDGLDDDTFGYQQRYAEYKYSQDTVHGDFRNSLDFWHMGRIFLSRPSLNESFVTSDPTDRIFAVQDETDQLWAQIYNEVKAQRPMPYFSDPSLS